MFPPRRIACLSSETAEICFRLGVGDRVVGRSAYCLRPDAVRGVRVVSSFTDVRMERIDEVDPDLVLTFSDIQADLCRDLVRAGRTVLALNHRSLAGVLDAVRLIGAAVGAPEAADALVAQMQARIDAVAARSAGWTRRPLVYFEEWDDPLVTGVGWVGELVVLAGGRDAFPERSASPRAPDRVVSPDQVIDRAPDVILGAWCGKPFHPERVAARPGWQHIPAVRTGHIHGLPDEAVLSAGPALLDGLDRIHALLTTWRRDTAPASRG